MRIAVTYENGDIFQHFGHTKQFKLYDIEEGKIVKEQIVDTNGQGHGALSGFLTNAGVEALICGGIGGGGSLGRGRDSTFWWCHWKCTRGDKFLFRRKSCISSKRTLYSF